MKSIFGILASPAKHSLSPIIHNSAFRSLGLDAEYLIFEKSPDQFDDFMKNLKSSNIKGLSVSLPYKEKVIQYLDEIDENARYIGAVNTIVKKNNKLYGYNTDWLGSNLAIQNEIGIKSLKDQIVVILGAGGSSRAIAYGCLALGADVWIKNRTKSKADKIAVEFAEIFKSEIHSTELNDMGHGDILINTTSIWLQENNENSTIYDYCNSQYLSNYHTVMDIVYKPMITPLLEAAFDGGCHHTITGEKMLLYQAERQFELWIDQKAPHDIMLKSLLSKLNE